MTSQISNCVDQASSYGFALSLYGWFCPVCHGQSDGYSAGLSTMQTLASKGILPGRDFTYFYVDVEDCDPDDDCWLDFATNQQYVLDVVAGLQAGGASVGIYASPYEWQLLMGSSTWKSAALASLPLWYPNWNGNPDMSGFSPFGGWSSPHMHQWQDSSSVCYDVDQDFIF